MTDSINSNRQKRVTGILKGQIQALFSAFQGNGEIASDSGRIFHGAGMGDKGCRTSDTMLDDAMTGV
jgi:hypothetical protein